MKKLLLVGCLFAFSGLCAAQTYIRHDEDSGGKLIIKVKGGHFSFAIAVKGTKAAPCRGYFEGVAEFETETLAEYNRDFNETVAGEAVSCRLTFIFNGRTVTVREHECSGSHGAACGFEGVYRLSR